MIKRAPGHRKYGFPNLCCLSVLRGPSKQSDATALGAGSSGPLCEMARVRPWVEAELDGLIGMARPELVDMVMDLGLKPGG